MATLRLLLLSAGTEVGRNVLAMLACRRAAVTLVATSDVANEPALFDCDAVHLLAPAASDGAFERALLDIMECERIDLVMPCSDDDVVSCARVRERHPRLGPRLLCGSRVVANVLVDRWASHDFCAAHDLPYAASIVGTSPDAQAALVRQRVEAAGGHATLIRASEQTRRNVDVFHPQAAGLAALSQRVRHSFDPRIILNRGRLLRRSAT